MSKHETGIVYESQSGSGNHYIVIDDGDNLNVYRLIPTASVEKRVNRKDGQTPGETVDEYLTNRCNVKLDEKVASMRLLKSEK